MVHPGVVGHHPRVVENVVVETKVLQESLCWSAM